MSYIEYVGRDAIVQADKVAYTYAVSETPRELQQSNRQKDNLNWSTRNNVVGDYIVYPYGNNNDLPDQIKEVVSNNSIAPGILNKKTELLWGSGPKLYKEVFEDRQLIKDWQDNTTIQAWLDTWDSEAYILQGCVEYQHMQGIFSKFIQAKGGRLGNNFIHSLEGVGPHRARLASLRTTTDYKPTHVITNDWSFAGPQSLEYKVYDKFNFLQPFASKNAILYSNMHSFCTDYYVIPSLYGNMEWMRNSTAVPLVLKALSKNLLGLKYHIVSPQAYWDAKKDLLIENCVKMGQEYNDKMLHKLQEDTLRTIGDVLSGIENTGKFLHTIKIIEIDGNNILEHGWEVNVIDQKISDLVNAQVKIADRADMALSAGIGLHGSLGNISGRGTNDSGSEQLYALKNYMATGIDIPEMIVLKAMNYALKANFPGLGLKMGFYHMQPEKEQDINPEKRLKNNV
ncbi:MAG: hypothetical protein V4581_14390 [Bacteroidota bacterium]